MTGKNTNNTKDAKTTMTSKNTKNSKTTKNTQRTAFLFLWVMFDVDTGKLGNGIQNRRNAC